MEFPGSLDLRAMDLTQRLSTRRDITPSDQFRIIDLPASIIIFIIGYWSVSIIISQYGVALQGAILQVDLLYGYVLRMRGLPLLRLLNLIEGGLEIVFSHFFGNTFLACETCRGFAGYEDTFCVIKSAVFRAHFGYEYLF